jgi:hypothetical protein
MKTTSYYIKARLFPTILTIIPLLILINVIVAPLYHDSLNQIFDLLPIVTNLGLSGALIFLMVQVTRLVSKEVFQRLYFQDEIYMPTTNQLLWSNTLIEKQTKIKIREKIQVHYDIILMDEEEESLNELTSRKQIMTAVSQIRNSLRGNTLLLQHNIEYGFFRNLLGGSLVALIFSIIILIYALIHHDITLTETGVVLVGLYLIPILLSKMFIRRYGNYYSKILYEQFLSIRL